MAVQALSTRSLLSWRCFLTVNIPLLSCKNWSQLTAEAEWQKRYDNGALVFDDKMWIFGGRDTSANHNTAAKNDVWFSDNGIAWNKQTEHALWTVRSGATSIVFKNKLWIFSGKHTGGKYNWGGDVWTMSIDK